MLLLPKFRWSPVEGRVLTCDTETTGLSPWKGDQPFAFSFCNEDGDTAYHEFPVDPKTRRVMYERDPKLRSNLRTFFRNPNVAKVFWNAKYDVRMINFALDIRVAGPIHEGMFAAHACNPSELTYALKPWTKKYAGYSDEDQDLLQKATVHLRRAAKARGWKIHEQVEADYWLCFYADVLLPDDPELAAQYKELCRQYAIQDAERTMLAWLFTQEKMRELGVEQVYADEMDLWPATMEMEDRGVRVDLKIVESQRKQYEAERDFFRGRLMEAGEEARLAGSLDTRVHGMVTQVDRLKSGRVRRIRMVGLAPNLMKEKWFAFKHVEGSYQIDEATVDVGDAIEVHEPFKQKQFNPGSDEQLAKLLYDHMALKVPENPYKKKKKRSVQRPVDADTLLELSADTELVDDILSWRASEKALDFLKAYELGIERVMDEMGRSFCLLHADFNQCGPRSGRFSCKRPNLQQAASKSTGRSAKPIDTRSSFGPRPGYVWYCIDYSQLEVRIFADLCKESEMLRIIRSGKHIHKACADHVWGFRDGHATSPAIKAAIHAMGYAYANTQLDTPQQKELRHSFAGVSEEEAAERWLASFDGSIVNAEASIDRENSKNKAKLAIFTRLFGGGIPSIMNLMKCSREDAKAFLDEYSEAFPDMGPWMKDVTRKARQEGCAWTAYGRRIVLDDLDKAYRAVNYRVQGSAADLMKRGMRYSYQYFKENQIDGGLVMTIHDELVFEFALHEPRMEHVLNLKTIMEDHGGAFEIAMPCEVKVVRQAWNKKEDLKWVKSLSLAT